VIDVGATEDHEARFELLSIDLAGHDRLPFCPESVQIGRVSI